MSVKKISLRKRGASFAGGDTLYPVTSWNFLVDRPASYNPAAHTHVKANITDFPTSMPASDVYAWAKAASKPAYTPGEIGTKTSAEITAEISAAINALIGGAPGALNTLNELAAAMADDAAFAATITSALAGKMNTSHPANNITSTHLYMANGDGFVWDDTGNIMYVRKDGTDYIIRDSGNFVAGVGASNWCAGNDNRLSNERNAADVSAWAKAAVKPSYTWSEINSKPSTFPPATHQHASFDRAAGNVGGNVISDITITNGVVTALSWVSIGSIAF